MKRETRAAMAWIDSHEDLRRNKERIVRWFRDQIPPNTDPSQAQIDALGWDLKIFFRQVRPTGRTPEGDSLDGGVDWMAIARAELPVGAAVETRGSRTGRSPLAAMKR